ncbi:MAG: hypothetical protein ABSD74_02135 [Rhizomicrobium sp.]|jgi:hypothetical protein
MTRISISLLVVTLGLAGCADPQIAALNSGRNYCAEQGKQFAVLSSYETGDGDIRGAHVEGRCVGPGETGYQLAQQGTAHITP